MLVDSHTHIHFPAYDADREAVIKRAQAAGVKMVCVGTQAATSESAIKLAEQYHDDIWATVGFHPNHLGEHWYHDKNEQVEAAPEKFDIKKLRTLAKNPKVAAIGECGLDYYRLSTSDSSLVARIKTKQKEVFLAQAELAKEFNKALMIHCRPSYVKASEGKTLKSTEDAYIDMLSMLSPGKGPYIAHFYVGGLEITKKLLAAGFYFTFGGVITFARDYDEVIKYIPLDRILLETDAPYVAPKPYRGQRNESAYIVETAKKLAEIKNISFEKVAEETTNNALKVFKI